MQAIFSCPDLVGRDFIHLTVWLWAEIAMRGKSCLVLCAHHPQSSRDLQGAAAAFRIVLLEAFFTPVVCE